MALHLHDAATEYAQRAQQQPDECTQSFLARDDDIQKGGLLTVVYCQGYKVEGTSPVAPTEETEGATKTREEEVRAKKKKGEEK